MCDSIPSRCSWLRRWSFLCLAAWWTQGCAPPAVDLYDPVAPAPATAPTTYDDQAWAVTLGNVVRDGSVDYAGLASNPQSLDAYLAHVTYIGPQSKPALFNAPGEAMCYYINVYNACVLKAVISESTPQTMHDVRTRRLESDYRFRVDNRVMTLGEMRNMARSTSGGDARVEFAFCSAARGSAPLAAEPFRHEQITERLKRLAEKAMDNPAMVQVDHERQRLLVALTIFDQQEAFKAQYRRETASSTATLLNCLMHMASGVRRQYLNRAIGYDIRVMPFDRGLNSSQTRGRAPAA